MEKVCCEICKKELEQSESLMESAWEDETMVCYDCYIESEGDVMEYLNDMYYACLNGCCYCCGCSCQ